MNHLWGSLRYFYIMKLLYIRLACSLVRPQLIVVVEEIWLLLVLKVMDINWMIKFSVIYFKCVSDSFMLDWWGTRADVGVGVWLVSGKNFVKGEKLHWS